MTRAAVSISSNIAEGAERNSKQEFIRFSYTLPKDLLRNCGRRFISNVKLAYFNSEVQKELVEELKKISSIWIASKRKT